MAADPAHPKPPHLSIETFRTLCAAATDSFALSPWEYLTDNNLFGIHDPATSQVRLASVMGNAKQAYGLIVHRGEQGLRWVLKTISNDDFDRHDPVFVHSRNAVMIELVNRKELDKHDLALLHAAGFKPLEKAPRKWLQFRSHKPGAMPWYLTQAEAELLLADLRKIAAFARLMSQHGNLYEIQGHKFPFLKNPASTGDLRPEDLDWQELVLAPQSLPPPIPLSDPERKEYADLPQDPDLRIELDCLYSPSAVFEPPCPYFPWLSLAVDAHSGQVLGTKLDNSQKMAPEDVAARCLFTVLDDLSCRPREIYVSRYPLAVALKPIADALQITLIKLSILPMLDMVYRDLRRGMQKGSK